MDSIISIVKSSDTLFHFTSREKAFENILNGGQLRLSPFEKLNDPKEYKNWSFTFVSDFREGQPNSLTLFKAQEAFNKAIKRKSKVVCFTQNDVEKLKKNPKDRFALGSARARMWTQHSEGHKGICLLFSKSKLKQSIKTQFENNSLIFHGKVQYRNFSHEAIKARMLDTNLLNISKIDDLVRNHLIRYHKAIFLEKNKDYRDESEYRWIIYNQSEDFEYISINDILLGIIVGDAFPNIYITVVKELASKYSVPFNKVEWIESHPVIVNLQY